MYHFLSYENICSFFSFYNIDITLLDSFGQALLIILSNIFQLLIIMFFILILFKVVIRIIRWVF